MLEYLRADERVLIIDDFLATGQTIAQITQAASVLIEKTFDGGRQALNVPIESLARIVSWADRLWLAAGCSHSSWVR